MIFKKIIPKRICLIFFVSFVLITPQLIMRSMIIGSDSIFHFNRFFDVASQIIDRNFQYFIHMYGFQQSGRIVNAIYGPLIAYFQGLLVWISPSWFVYQLLSNFILYFLSGLCMYIFLISGSIKQEIAFYFSLLFMTTFSIQYWITRQGFSSWGAAFLPLCLLPIIQFQKNNKFNIFQVAFSVALMTQLHLFTALILVKIYFVYFLILFFLKGTDRLRLITSLCYALLLYFALTLNIWYSFYIIYGGNFIISPFVNETMYLNTITANSYYWIVNPVFLILFLGIKFYYDFKHWREYDAFEKTTTFLIIYFLLLTTNLIPWKYLTNNEIININFIQFPFRFFVPFTVIMLSSTAYIFNSCKFSWHKKNFFKLILFVSLIQVILLVAFTGFQWRTEDPIQSKHMTIRTNDNDLLRQSFFDKDKSLSLELAQKSTPDYLPSYHSEESNKYHEYKTYVIDEDKTVDKHVENGILIVKWESMNSEIKNIPIIIYRCTEILHNGEFLDTDEIQLSSIGTPQIVTKKGENILEVSYKVHKVTPFLLGFTIFCWIFILIILFYDCYKKKYCEIFS